MTPKHMRHLANKAIKDGISTIILRMPRKRPEGFPRGRLLAECQGFNIFSYDPKEIIDYLDKYGA